MTVILVIFADEDVATAVDARVNALRFELNRKETFEFHFKDCSDSIRDAFFHAVSPFNFIYTGIAIDKERWNMANMGVPSTFYKTVCGWVFEHARPYLSEANVKIDRSGGEEFCRELASHLKRSTNDPKASIQHIKQVAMLSSKASNLVQLADMLSGAVGRSYRTDRPDPHRFRKIIAHREVTVRYLPE